MVKLDKTLIVIVGPTAIGKTSMSIEIAKRLNCPILSTDSRQFYKEMSIGTAKPSAAELNEVQHYFINSRSIQQEYTAGMFESDAIAQLEDIFKSFDHCVAVGGSGLYINALCYGIDDIPSNETIRQKLFNRWKNEGLEKLQIELKEIDPEFYAESDMNNPRRVMRALEVFEITGEKYSALRTKPKKERDFRIKWLGLEMELEDLYPRINQRVDTMMENGLLDEVKSLHEFKGLKALKTVGYQELMKFLDQEISLEEAVELVKRNSRRFARKQYAWFRRNNEINWFKTDQKEAIIQYVDSI